MVAGHDENGDCFLSRPHTFDPAETIGTMRNPLNLETPEVIKLLTLAFGPIFGNTYCTISVYKIFRSGDEM